MSRLSRVLATILLIACLPVAAVADEGEDLTLFFRAAVTIEADGSLSALAWEDAGKIPAALRARLDERVHAWTFEPGEIDGRPARTETTLRLRLLATPRDGALALHVESADTGPEMDGVMPPEYPREALRRGAEGQVLAGLVVEPDGTRHVTLEQYQGDDRHRRVFLEAVKPTLQRIDVRHERVGGNEVAARFAVPISFCLNAGCDMAFAPAADKGTSLPTTAPGQPMPQDSVARLVTNVRGTDI